MPSDEVSVGDTPVELEWIRLLGDVLPSAFPVETRRRYVNFVLADPRLVWGDPPPDAALQIVDEQLRAFTPMAFFDVELPADGPTWDELRESLLNIAEDGLEGNRRGPASVAPGVDPGPAIDEEALAELFPEAYGPPDATSEEPERLASGVEAVEGDRLVIDPASLTRRDLRRIVEVSDLSVRDLEAVLESVSTPREGTDEGG